MNANPTPLSTDARSIAVRSIHIMAKGSRAEFDAVVHPQAVDRENKVQPPASRVPGPAGFHATALWLRAAFADLHYDIHHVVAEGGLVAVNSTMNGQHVAPIVLYTDDGQVIEHWANRDDLGQAKQLGWVPPTPAYLLRMARAKGRAKRALS